MASNGTAQNTHKSSMTSQPGASSGNASNAGAASGSHGGKRKHRAGKKHRKNRRQSFAAPSEPDEMPETGDQRPSLLDVPEHKTTEEQFYRLGAARKTSQESIDSEALLDHRNQQTSRPRRQSILHSMHAFNSDQTPRPRPRSSHHYYSMSPRSQQPNDENEPTERTPLVSGQSRPVPASAHRSSTWNARNGSPGVLRPMSSNRRPSASSSLSTKKRRRMPSRQQSSHSIPQGDDYDINNPPSQPGSPRLGPDDDFDEVMLPEFHKHGSREGSRTRDHIINIDEDEDLMRGYGASPLRRRPTLGRSPVEDVCLPFDQMTDIPEEDFMHQEGSEGQPRRSRKRPWPDLSALEEWSQEEKEERTMEGVRAKKVSEPEMVGGRLRPSRVTWQRDAEEEATFRFTYFNEDLDSSLRSFTLSGLQQLGHSFRELFIPEAPEIEDSSDEDDDDPTNIQPPERASTPLNNVSRAGTRQSSVVTDPRSGDRQGALSGRTTPVQRIMSPITTNASTAARPKRHGPRPVFWLDVLQPTFEEMRVICRAFGIHKLTAEDIMEQEAREKVELFRNYYFVNYRTFDQDQQSNEYLEPVNMYFIVFKGGVISFHFSQIPHPPNVRRRIRQLAEHQYTDSDWISYAIIDNITDAYAPLIEQIEKEVDEIDDEILQLHSRADATNLDESESNKASQTLQTKLAKGTQLLSAFKSGDVYEKLAESSDSGRSLAKEPTHGDMLLRVGECRKKVMGLYRLLGNKADVIKGLAKRCNEQWQVAPRSDVGLYLGDIQDHIVTMTANLTHYENILSRAHSNYLAQINIKMTERAEQTNDVLGKLTVLGTIVLPMNIITGMWGMNVTVPGQDNGNMMWFWGITAGLAMFGITCFLVARRLYRVV